VHRARSELARRRLCYLLRLKVAGHWKHLATPGAHGGLQRAAPPGRDPGGRGGLGGGRGQALWRGGGRRATGVAADGATHPASRAACPNPPAHYTLPHPPQEQAQVPGLFRDDLQGRLLCPTYATFSAWSARAGLRLRIHRQLSEGEADLPQSCHCLRSDAPGHPSCPHRPPHPHSARWDPSGAAYTDQGAHRLSAYAACLAQALPCRFVFAWCPPPALTRLSRADEANFGPNVPAYLPDTYVSAHTATFSSGLPDESFRTTTSSLMHGIDSLLYTDKPVLARSWLYSPSGYVSNGVSCKFDSPDYRSDEISTTRSVFVPPSELTGLATPPHVPPRPPPESGYTKGLWPTRVTMRAGDKHGQRRMRRASISSSQGKATLSTTRDSFREAKISVCTRRLFSHPGMYGSSHGCVRRCRDHCQSLSPVALPPPANGSRIRKRINATYRQGTREISGLLVAT
jgi:hypothetical protein